MLALYFTSFILSYKQRPFIKKVYIYNKQHNNIDDNMNVQENIRNIMSDQILVMYARAYEY